MADFDKMQDDVLDFDSEFENEVEEEEELESEPEEPSSSGEPVPITDPNFIPFTHLHVHSHYSLLDGAGKIDDLIQRAKELGMTSLALTDHGNLHGMLEFYRKATAAKIKPILGYEAYVAPGSRFNKSKGTDQAGNHLTLLVMNDTGYHNLLKMATKASFEGFYHHARIDRELLTEYNEGLICLSGCLSSELSRTLLRGNANTESMEAARNIARWYRELFQDRYYIELQDHGIESQQIVLQASIQIAKELGIPTVVTNDVHYVRREDWEIQDLLLCINTKEFRTSPNRWRMDSKLFYLRSGREMLDSLPDCEDAIRRTVEVADRCNCEPVLGKRFFPNFVPPDGMTSEDYLRKLCLEGLKRRYADNPKRMVNGELTTEVIDRLNRELSVINKLGFPNYFLIVWDFVRFAEEHGIQRTARGSGVGALVCYALNLSHICPLEYDLLFERFLDENRLEAPDIDIDFDRLRRSEVLDYVKSKYGEENVAQIGTFGTMAARGVIKDVARALGLPLAQSNMVTKLVPEGPKVTLKKVLDKEEIEKYPELEKLVTSGDPEIKEVIEYGLRMEGLVRSTGIHACAVVISDQPLTNFVPLHLAKGEESVTQWAAGDVEKAGLLKMDFLGLLNLSILANVIDLIEETTHQKIDPYRFPLDDQETYALLCRGETKGIFQLESSGIRELLVRMKPDNFRDIIATLALYRPGPLKGGMVDDYVDIKHGRKQPANIHPVMTDVLADTHGIMVYQEQVMRIVNRLGNIPLSSAYSCIKAISKKIHEKIAVFRGDFIKGAIENGLTTSKAEDIFGLIIQFAEYGFNKSHSTAYALIAYMTAYLKAHYPTEFMASLLCGDILKRNYLKKDSTVEHLQDCEQMNIPIIWPNINISYGQYRVKDGNLIFGLEAIKGVGGAPTEIVRAREEGGPFKNIFDFFERIDPKLVPRAAVESLLKAGAFDCFGVRRSQLLSVLDKAQKSAQSVHEDRQRGQKSLFDLLDEQEESSTEKEDAPAQIDYPDIEEWNDREKGTYEKEVLGFYLTTHPFKGVEEKFQTFTSHSITGSKQLPDRTRVILGGMISNVQTNTTRKQREGVPNVYARFDLEDTQGTIQSIIWPQQYALYSRNIKEGELVLATGRVEEGRSGKENDHTFIIDRLFTLEEAEQQLTCGVCIHLSEGEKPEEDIQRLYDILKRYRTDGNGLELTIELKFKDGRYGRLKCSDFLIHVNEEMKQRLSDGFGPGTFQMVATPYRQTQEPERNSWSRKNS